MSKVSREILEKIMDNNEYVEGIAKNDTFIYSDYFYLDLYRKLETGLSDIEAYEALGFDTKVLGKDRAYSACRHARKLAKDKSFKTNPNNYDGSRFCNNYDSLTQEEQLAYLKARNEYLEAVFDLQKKTSKYVQTGDISWMNKK